MRPLSRGVSSSPPGLLWCSSETCTQCLETEVLQKQQRCSLLVEMRNQCEVLRRLARPQAQIERL